MNRICALIRDPRDVPGPFYCARTQWEGTSYEPRSGPSPEPDYAGTLILGFQLPELWEINSCCYKQHSFDRREHGPTDFVTFLRPHRRRDLSSLGQRSRALSSLPYSVRSQKGLQADLLSSETCLQSHTVSSHRFIPCGVTRTHIAKGDSEVSSQTLQSGCNWWISVTQDGGWLSFCLFFLVFLICYLCVLV